MSLKDSSASTAGRIALDVARNCHASRSAMHDRVAYIVESANWSVKWDGRNLTRLLHERHGVPVDVRYTPLGLRNHIIHFGSIHLFERLSWRTRSRLASENTIIVSWFHGGPDERIQRMRSLKWAIDAIHTSSTHTKSRLVDAGYDPSTIHVIPVLVDTQMFHEQNDRLERSDLKIPDGAFVIGSFQKDGVGWGSGHEPKLRKGPDVLVDVLEELHQRHEVFALLLGPSRGYVTDELDDRGVPYHHEVVNAYRQIPAYYDLLDAYLITSRAEGGPKPMLEAMAAGVPVVTTDVGMAPLLRDGGSHISTVDVDDRQALVSAVEHYIDDRRRAEHYGLMARTHAAKFDMREVLRDYYHEIYRPVLS